MHPSGVLVRRVERDELELRARQRDETALGEGVELGPEDGARRLHDGRVVQPDQVALHERARGQVRQKADRVPIGDELHVAVPALP